MLRRRVAAALIVFGALSLLGDPFAEAQLCLPPGCPAAVPADPAAAGGTPASTVPPGPAVGPETIRVTVDTPPFAETPAHDPLRPSGSVTGFALAATLGGGATVLLMLRTLARNRLAWQAGQQVGEAPEPRVAAGADASRQSEVPAPARVPAGLD